MIFSHENTTSSNSFYAPVYRHDRLAWAMRKIEVETCARRSRCSKCVDDDNTGPTLHDRHVRHREAANLRNAVGNLKQSVYGLELRLTPKTGFRVGGASCSRNAYRSGLVGLRVIAMNPRIASSKSCGSPKRQLRQNSAVGDYNGWLGGHRPLGAPLVQYRDQSDGGRKSA